MLLASLVFHRRGLNAFRSSDPVTFHNGKWKWESMCGSIYGGATRIVTKPFQLPFQRTHPWTPPGGSPISLSLLWLWVDELKLTDSLEIFHRTCVVWFLFPQWRGHSSVPLPTLIPLPPVPLPLGRRRLSSSWRHCTLIFRTRKPPVRDKYCFKCRWL